MSQRSRTFKKKELKELAQKAKALPKKEIEVKAAEYDKLEEKKKQILEAPKTIKRSTKKVTEEEEEEETKPIKKVTVNKNNNNSLEENVSMLSIQQKLKLERQKMLMSALTPMCQNYIEILFKSFIPIYFRMIIYNQRVIWFRCCMFIHFLKL